MFNINKNRGFIRWILLIIIGIIILSYFGFDLRTIIEDDQTQENVGYVWGFVLMVWENYLQTPVLWVWNNIILFIWNDLFLDNLHKLGNGELSNEIYDATPRASY
jgi:hypothetical protein